MHLLHICEIIYVLYILFYFKYILYKYYIINIDSYSKVYLNIIICVSCISYYFDLFFNITILYYLSFIKIQSLLSQYLPEIILLVIFGIVCILLVSYYFQMYFL